MAEEAGDRRSNPQRHERLDFIVLTASEWSVDLGLAPPTPAVVARVRAILDLIPAETVDAEIRLFPSEDAGITLQRQRGDLRMVDVDPSGLHATWVPVDNRAYQRDLGDNRAVVAFLIPG